MQVKGAFEVTAPREVVWESLWQDASLPIWIPGCTSARWESPDRLTAEVEESIAQLTARMQFAFSVVERVATDLVRFEGQGLAPAVNTSVEMTIRLMLAPLPDAQRTQVQYQVEADVKGRLATIGQFVLNTKAKDVQRRLAASVKQGLDREA